MAVLVSTAAPGAARSCRYILFIEPHDHDVRVGSRLFVGLIRAGVSLWEVFQWSGACFRLMGEARGHYLADS